MGGTMSDYDPVGYNDTRGAGAPPPSTGLAIGSLVTGIIALLLSLIPVIGFISWILAPAGLIMGVIAFLKQDGGMVNLQNEGLRYDPALIWIDDADKQAKWYQQLKREWIRSRAEQRPFANPVKPTILRWKI